MRIAIVDDVAIYRNQLQDLLTEELNKIGFQNQIFESFPDAEDFLLSWEPGQFDLIFLDIYMPNMDGVDLAKEIRKADQDVTLVFSTNSNEFATESYAVNASYYLCKPFVQEEIAMMLDRIDLAKKEKTQSVQFDDGFICLLNNICFTDYDNHKITIYLKDGDDHSMRMSQKEIGNILLAYEVFCQINQGTIINLRLVESLQKDHVVMQSGEILSISRSRQKSTAEAYAAYKLAMMKQAANQAV